MREKKSAQGPLAAFNYPQYRYIWVGQLSTTTAMMMDMVTRGWLVYDLTGSAAQLAFVSAVRGLPLLFFGLVAGVLVDRFNRKQLLLTSQWTNVLLNLLLGVLILTDTVSVWHIYLTGLIAGTTMAVQQPARQSMLPATVPRETLQNAVVLNNGTLNIGSALGPALGGMSVALLGMGTTYILQGALFFLAVLVTVKMSPEVAKPPVRDQREGMVQSMVEGFRYVRHNAVVMALLLLALIPMFFGNPFQSLVPMFADEVLQSGSQGAGILLGALGAGSMVSMIVLAFLPPIQRAGRLVIVTATLFGAALMVFAASSSFWLSVGALFAAGWSRATYRTINQMMLLQETEEAYRGRVNSMYMLDRGLMPMGTIVLGLLAEWMGAPHAVLLMSSLCVLLTLGSLLVSPTLWRFRRQPLGEVAATNK